MLNYPIHSADSISMELCILRATDNKSSCLSSSNDEKTFHIRYIHSIHLSDVFETYKITNDHQIQIFSLEYEDFAIGMPSGAGEGEKFFELDGKYYITNMSQVFPSISMLVGDVNKDLAFKYNNNEYNLKDYLLRGESYTFQVARLSLLDQLRGARIRE